MQSRYLGSKLEMNKFDGMDPIGWVAQMEYFFFLHHICNEVDKLQFKLLYLDVESSKWW